MSKKTQRNLGTAGHGTRLRKARTAKGWSQAELARRAKCHQVSVAHFEKGLGTERSKALARVRKVLGLA